jgi:hypothetical protein
MTRNDHFQSQHGQVHLQGEDRLLVHLGDCRAKAYRSNVPPVSTDASTQPSTNDSAAFTGSKQWVVVTIPHTYSSTNWPIRVRNSQVSCSVNLIRVKI